MTTEPEAQGTSQDGKRARVAHYTALFLMMRSAAANVPEFRNRPVRSTEFWDPSLPAEKNIKNLEAAGFYFT